MVCLVALLLVFGPSVFDNALTHQTLCRFLWHGVLLCRVAVRLDHLKLLTAFFDLNLQRTSIVVSLTRLRLLINASW